MRKSCGTWLSLRYFWIAELGAVPIVANMKATLSLSTSLRVCSTVLGGEKPSSRLSSVSLRPFTPPFSLIMVKYAAITLPTVPSAEAGPL